MNAKKTVYIIAAMFLGALLIVIVCAGIEIQYLKWLVKSGSDCGAVCHFSGMIRAGLIIGGMAGGYFLGQKWWRIVYVEKRHWRINKEKE